MLQKGKWWKEGKPQLEWHHLKSVSRKRPGWRTGVRGALPRLLSWVLRGREGRRTTSAGHGACGCKIVPNTVSQCNCWNTSQTIWSQHACLIDCWSLADRGKWNHTDVNGPSFLLHLWLHCFAESLRKLISSLIHFDLH